MADNADTVAVKAAIMGDLNVADGLALLAERNIPVEYTDQAAQQLMDEANLLAEQAGALKVDEAPQAERQAAHDAVERVLNARAMLYRLRGAQPGDVTIGIPPVGSPE